MPPELSADSKFEIGHVLFIDIVGYSKLLIEEQKERLDQLTKIVLGTAHVRDSTDEQVVRLRTGDGMALVFRHSAEEPARCALEIAEALARGIPVLATRAGALPDTLGHAPDGSRPGLLVPHQDPEAMAIAIEEAAAGESAEPRAQIAPPSPAQTAVCSRPSCCSRRGRAPL